MHLEFAVEIIKPKVNKIKNVNHWTSVIGVVDTNFLS